MKPELPPPQRTGSANHRNGAVNKAAGAQPGFETPVSAASSQQSAALGVHKPENTSAELNRPGPEQPILKISSHQVSAWLGLGSTRSTSNEHTHSFANTPRPSTSMLATDSNAPISSQALKGTPSQGGLLDDSDDSDTENGSDTFDMNSLAPTLPKITSKPTSFKGRLSASLKRSITNDWYGHQASLRSVPPLTVESASSKNQSKTHRSRFESVIQESHFASGRGLSQLNLHLSADGLSAMADRLTGKTLNIIEYGCGEGNLLKDLTDPLSRQEIFAKEELAFDKYFGEQSTYGTNEQGRAQWIENHEALSKIDATLSRKDSIHCTGITVKISDQAKSDIQSRSNITLIDGLLERQIPENERSGPYDLAIDMVGVAAYTPDLSQYLNTVFRSLTEGGQFVLVQESDVSVNGLPLGDFLASIDGIERVHHNRTSAVFVKKTHAESFIPPIKIDPSASNPNGRQFKTVSAETLNHDLIRLSEQSPQTMAHAPEYSTLFTAVLDEALRTGDVKLIETAEAVAGKIIRAIGENTDTHSMGQDTQLNGKALRATLTAFAQKYPQSEFPKLIREFQE